jgi:DNA-binding MarR family transcriptional regulator
MASSANPDQPEGGGLVERLDARLREVGVVVAVRVMRSWSDASKLTVEEAALVLTLASRAEPPSAHELAELTGISVDEAYPVLHHLEGRGDVVEEHRRYSLTTAGRESVAALEAAGREGVAAFLGQLPDEEQRRLEAVLGGATGE